MVLVHCIHQPFRPETEHAVQTLHEDRHRHELRVRVTRPCVAKDRAASDCFHSAESDTLRWTTHRQWLVPQVGLAMTGTLGIPPSRHHTISSRPSSANSDGHNPCSALAISYIRHKVTV